FALETQVTGWSIIVSFAVAAIVGLGFGIYPAVIASRQDPIVALRHDSLLPCDTLPPNVTTVASHRMGRCRSGAVRLRCSGRFIAALHLNRIIRHRHRSRPIAEALSREMQRAAADDRI